MIMGFEKSHTPLSASWRHRKDSGVIRRPESWGPRSVSSSLRAGEDQRPSSVRQTEPVLPPSTSVLDSGRHLIRRGPPALRSAICFTQSTHSDANLIQKRTQIRPEIMLNRRGRLCRMAASHLASILSFPAWCDGYSPHVHLGG